MKNPIYMGRFDFLGRSYTGSHEPLISADLFNTVQAVFKGHNKPKYRKHEFAFGGLLTCAECGCTITAELKKGRYVYYRCTTRRGACPQGKVVREEVLTEQFAQVVERITLDANSGSLDPPFRSHWIHPSRGIGSGIPLALDPV